MLKITASDFKQVKPEPDRFPTIDDAFTHIEESYHMLKQLKGLKHPLGIRRGVEKATQSSTKSTATSRTLKAQGKRFFFDLKQTEEGKAYLVITESRMKDKAGKRYRASVAVFPDDAAAFGEAIQEMISMLKP